MINPIDYLTRFWHKIIFPTKLSTDFFLIGGPESPVSPKFMAWLTFLSGVGGVIMFIDWIVKLIWP